MRRPSSGFTIPCVKWLRIGWTIFVLARKAAVAGLDAHVKQILSPDQIRAGVRELAERITAIYGQRPITIVAILTGSLVLLADLMRQLEMPLRVALVQGNRHRGTADPRPGLVINDTLIPNLKGREVLVIDDIFDTGHTLVEVLSQLLAQEPTSIRSAVLMRKTDRSEVAVQPDHVMFEIPDEFVVGYGLDYEDRYRNLPYVAALEPEDLARIEHAS
jgi:hypoxanthine phosphoribosyltransferase